MIVNTVVASSLVDKVGDQDKTQPLTMMRIFDYMYRCSLEDRERSPKRRLRLQVLSLDVGCGFNHVARIMPLVSVFHRLLGA
jgi:hypothetical protein